MMYLVGVTLLVILAFGLGFYSYPLLMTATAPALSADSALAHDGNRLAMPLVTSNSLAQSANAISPTDAFSTSQQIDISVMDPEDLKLLLDGWQALNLNYYGEKPESRQQVYGAFRGLLTAFDDPYTFFIEPEAYEVEQGNLRGSFGGIGAHIEPTDQGYILEPLRDSPAETAGIQKGDMLIGVDGRHIDNDVPVDDVVALIRGPLDTDVMISVLRLSEQDGLYDDMQEIAFTITRAEIQTPSMDWRVIEEEEYPKERLREKGIHSWSSSAIGYIQHRIFSDRSPSEMSRAIKELSDAGVKKFIIDLRGNPGGPVNAVVQLTDLWIDGGTIMIEEKADGEEKVFEASDEVADGIGSETVTIIIDGASASASEIFAGALRDHERAVLVGSTTFGKGSVQIIHVLPDSSSMHITNAHWFTPKGHRINGEGLEPDIVLAADDDFVQEAILVSLSNEAKPIQQR